MRGAPIPASLSDIDTITYFALCFIYERYRSGDITREKGGTMKRKIYEAYERIEALSNKSNGMWSRIEGAGREYALHPTIESADKFHAAVYNMPDDWRVQRLSAT